MKLFQAVLRALIFIIAFYVIAYGDFALGVVILGGTLFSFLFHLRSTIFIEPSTNADYWELFGTGLVFAHSLILGFGNYNDPSYGWFDIPMHIAGGAFVALWTLLVFSAKRERAKLGQSPLLQAFIGMGIVALVGVGWEFFEWAVDHTFGAWYNLPKAQASLDDTMGDLLSDLVGGLLLWFRKRY